MHVTPIEIVGVYTSGPERLELQSTGICIQDDVSNPKRLHHTGQWRIVDHFWNGSEIVLANAAVTSPATPEDKEPSRGFGELRMYVHKRSGKIALARNEVADWYYERTQ
jgi:hypothetical protein